MLKIKHTQLNKYIQFRWAVQTARFHIELWLQTQWHKISTSSCEHIAHLTVHQKILYPWQVVFRLLNSHCINYFESLQKYQVQRIQKQKHPIIKSYRLWNKIVSIINKCCRSLKFPRGYPVQSDKTNSKKFCTH